MKMKRLISLLLIIFTLFAFPLASLAEQPFIFRDRYTWGMSLEEVKQQAAQEGLTFIYDDGVQVNYRDVPVVGIVAEDLCFSAKAENGLDRINYSFTDDPAEALILFHQLLETLTLIYGEPDEVASKDFITQWKVSHVSVWPMPNVFIVLLGQDPYTGNCSVTYLRDRSLLPSPSPIPTDGL